MYVNSKRKIIYDFFTILYKLLHYRNNMHECMYVNSKKKIIYNFYDFLQFFMNILQIATLWK